MSNRPATVLMQTYQSERYVRDAVLSALAQTYSPLEVVISDDCSKDGTYEIVKETVATYQGPHEVRLYRNPERLFYDHFNKAMTLVRGDYIVYASDDDVSMPQRTETVMRAWAETGADVITCNCVITNADGVPQGFAQDPLGTYDVSLTRSLKESTVMSWGSAMSFSRRLWETFGPMPKIRAGDWIIAFWGLLLGGNHFIREPQLAYRVHSENWAWGFRTPQSDKDKLLMSEAKLWQKISNRLAMLDAVEKLRQLQPSDPRPGEVAPVIEALLRGETQEWCSLRYEMGRREYGLS